MLKVKHIPHPPIKEILELSNHIQPIGITERGKRHFLKLFLDKVDPSRVHIPIQRLEKDEEVQERFFGLGTTVIWTTNHPTYAEVVGQLMQQLKPSWLRQVRGFVVEPNSLSQVRLSGGYHLFDVHILGRYLPREQGGIETHLGPADYNGNWALWQRQRVTETV